MVSERNEIFQSRMRIDCTLPADALLEDILLDDNLLDDILLKHPFLAAPEAVESTSAAFGGGLRFLASCRSQV